MIREIKFLEFYAKTGNADEQTLAGLSTGSFDSVSKQDDPNNPIKPSLRSVEIDPTRVYSFHAYLWAAYNQDSFAMIRAQLRLQNSSSNDLAKIQFVYAYKQGSFAFSTILTPLHSGFTWGTTHIAGDLGFNPQDTNATSQGEGNSNAVTYLHPRIIDAQAAKMHLDLIGWYNIDWKNVHAFIAAIPQ